MIYYCMKMLKTKQMWLEQTTYFSTNECISLIIKIDIVLYLHKCKPLPIKIRHKDDYLSLFGFDFTMLIPDCGFCAINGQMSDFNRKRFAFMQVKDNIYFDN
jgi:hypothetical protein